MPKSILKNKQGELIVKLVNDTSATIDFADGVLEWPDTFDEGGEPVEYAPTKFYISDIFYTGDAPLTITRDSNVVASLHSPVDWDRLPFVMNDDADSAIEIATTATGYTLIVCLKAMDYKPVS